MRTERALDEKRDAGRHPMEKKLLTPAESGLLDVPALRARCEFIASTNADYRDRMRSALLAEFKTANAAGRERARDFGIGPYLGATTVAFEDLRLAAGPTLLLPYAEDFPFVVSLGGLVRDGRDLGLDASLFWGTRGYNFQGVYNIALGFSLGWQHLFTDEPNDVVQLAAHVDGMVLALPFVAAYSALFQ